MCIYIAIYTHTNSKFVLFSENIDGLLSSCLSNKSKIVPDKENKMVENNKKVIKKKKAVNDRKRKFDTSERTWHKSVQSTDSGMLH